MSDQQSESDRPATTDTKQEGPDDSEPTPERRAELEAAYEANVAAGKAPYASVRIRTLGELHWIMQERHWSGEYELPEGYERANLSGAGLIGVNLSGAELWDANLSGAGLGSHANLSGAVLSGADLSGAGLIGVNLSGAALRGANLSGATLFGVDLSRAHLDGANLSGAALDSDVNLSGAVLSGVDLSRAHLIGVNLSGVRLDNLADLSRAFLRGANLSGADLSGADLSRAGLAGADLSGATLPRANLSGAALFDANLSGAELRDANLSGADLARANLSGAVFDNANLSGAALGRATLSGADLRVARMDATTNLRDARLDAHTRVADVVWNDVPLTRLNWQDVTMLGDEQVAHNSKDANGKPKDKAARLRNYADAVLANRQVATVLRSQGVNEHADRFAYRAQLCQRRILRLQRHYLRYLGSLFLGLISGYGYRPLRSFATYLLVVTVFGLAYWALGIQTGHTLSWNEAGVVSLTAFHGRGFFATAFQPGDPQAALAAIEAVLGLLIEITFIATFTQRFFAR